MLDLASLFENPTDESRRSDARSWVVRWLPLIALILCLGLIVIGAYVLSQVGLEGLRPIDPKDAYYGS